MRALLSATAAGCAALFLTGCGIKGPLTLPPATTPAKVAPAGAADHSKAPSAPTESK